MRRLCAAGSQVKGRRVVNKSRDVTHDRDAAAAVCHMTTEIRMGYTRRDPKNDKPPLVLCHGGRKLAFSWRPQNQGAGRG